MEKFQITDPPKVWVSSFLRVDINGISVSATIKSGHYFISAENWSFPLVQFSNFPLVQFTLSPILGSVSTFMCGYA